MITTISGGYFTYIMGLTVITLAIAIFAGVMATIAAVVGAIALIEIKGLKNSTHNIQYVPVDSVIDPKADEKLSNELRKTGVMAEQFDELPDEVIL